MQVLLYRGSTSLTLPNNAVVNYGDMFVVVEGKGLVHMWNSGVLQKLQPVFDNNNIKTTEVDSTQMLYLWQIMTPSGGGTKPAL